MTEYKTRAQHQREFMIDHKGLPEIYLPSGFYGLEYQNNFIHPRDYYQTEFKVRKTSPELHVSGWERKLWETTV
jgi:hypothetical protein